MRIPPGLTLQHSTKNAKTRLETDLQAKRISQKRRKQQPINIISITKHLLLVAGTLVLTYTVAADNMVKDYRCAC